MKKNEQAENSQTQSMATEDFRDFIRTSLDARVREFALGYVGALILEEIETLCGKAGEHKRDRGLAHRGGSQRGSIVLDGERVAIQRPRARRNGKEVKLERYEILQDRSDLREHVERLMLAGISTRNYEKTLRKTEASLGLSRSAVSREFVKSSRESLNHLNSRRFPDQTFWCIVLDGIVFGGSVVIVALGVDTAGNKHFLGISEGSTENADSALSVLQSIESRDIRFTDRVLVVMDGSKALEKAAREFFGKKAEIQLCYLHKQRNVLAKLPRKYHAEFCKRYKQAFSANSYEDVASEMRSVLSWLESISYSASQSLQEGLEALLTLHRINMPPKLRTSFYTTNLIDSAFSNPRSQLNRVKRSRPQTDQVLRWVGSLLLSQEEQFRKVRSYTHIHEFLNTFLDKKIDERISA